MEEGERKWQQSLVIMASGTGTVVKYLPCNLKVKSLSPATAPGSWIEKMAKRRQRQKHSGRTIASRSSGQGFESILRH